MPPPLHAIAATIKTHFSGQVGPPLLPGRRIPPHLIFRALESIRPVLATHFGEPIKSRFSGSSTNVFERTCDAGPFKVLEYLVDFSFSRYSIPQAIGDPRAAPIADGKFQLVFVAESELGTDNEVCRDLLKLLDTRSVIRCLLFRKRRRKADAQRLNDRMIQVFQHYAELDSVRAGCLFVPLDVCDAKVNCSFLTLDNDATSLVEIEDVDANH